MTPAQVSVQALARGLLVGGVCWLTFGGFPAFLAAISAATLAPWETWVRRRRRWGARCAATLVTWPLSAGLVVALFFQVCYAAVILDMGGPAARKAVAGAIQHLPADPEHAIYPFHDWLSALPWHVPYWGGASYTLLETSALLACVLTLVTYGGVFLADSEGSSPAPARALQTIGSAVGAVVIGLVWFKTHGPPAVAIGPLNVTPPPTPARPDPVGLWGYALLVGTACPLATVVADWLNGLRPAPQAPAPRSAPLGASSARG
jgi:hypothetical protein